MKKLVAAFTLLLAVLFTVSGEESWEGNAAVIRGGRLDHSGFYAVSNSFSKYSKIVITNLKNGKKAAVTVLDRIPETSNMFILLSRDAAKELGMPEDGITRVTVTLSIEPGVVTEGMPEDLSYNPDPDINPAVLIPEEKKIEQPEEKVTEEKKPAPVKVSENKVSVPKNVKEAAPNAEKIKSAEENINSGIVEYLSKRKPEKDLFKKPEKREALTLIEKPKTPEGEKASINLKPELSEEELRKQIQIADVVGKPAVSEVEKPSMELPGLENPGVEIPVEQKTPERTKINEAPVQPEVSEAPKKGESSKPSASAVITKPGRLKLTLKPTEPKPPPSVSKPAKPTKVSGPVPEKKAGKMVVKKPAEKPIEKTVAPVNAVSGIQLPKKTYFLQLGSYSSLVLAEKLASGLKGTYPVTVLHSQGGKHILYKVLVGPLNKEESGTLLFWFRVRGYKDSFLRYID